VKSSLVVIVVLLAFPVILSVPEIARSMRIKRT
jgi:hypothetical protein